jgi:pentatricopeptide repeat protein
MDFSPTTSTSSPLQTALLLIFVLFASTASPGESLTRVGSSWRRRNCQSTTGAVVPLKTMSKPIARPSCDALHVALGTSSEMLEDSSTALSDMYTQRSHLTELLLQNNFEQGFVVLQSMLQKVEGNKRLHVEERRLVSESVDGSFQMYTRAAFAPSFRVLRCVQLGADAIQLQASSRLVEPYNQVPRRSLLDALRALTSQTKGRKNTDSSSPQNLDAAFRILQRLITGVGVRNMDTNMNSLGQFVGEKDFNMVLNAFSNSGRMDMAQRIVSLQRRTPSAPPLSPVAYSILLKGYGRLGDLEHVGMLLRNAQEDGIVPDTILLNTIVDAYINCNALGKAQALFEQMRTGATTSDATLFCDLTCPPPNRRTYNTMLKGFANAGMMDQAFALSLEMKQARLWDSITTNTVVHAAVVAKQYQQEHSR